MDAAKKKSLQITANKVRQLVIEGTYNAKCGHPGGSLSMTDMLTYLYFDKMNVNPDAPQMDDRDRFVLSKGHCAPALYGALALRGFFPTEDIKTLRKYGSYLQGHPDMKNIPGVDMSSGSLGQGVSCAVGMALSMKLQGRTNHVFTILGDGEIEEGQVWEAAMFASHKKLDNLTVIVDNNNLQIDGAITEVNSPYPIVEKFVAFGFETLEIDGHDFDAIEKAIDSKVEGKPLAIIMKTTKGKGVSFMENKCDWHGKAPNAEEYEIAMAELKAECARLEAE